MKGYTIAIILIPITFILLSTFLFAFSKPYYYREQAKLGIHDRAATSDLVDYLRTGQGDLSHFSERSQTHLKDVRQIFHRLFRLLIGCIALLLCTAWYFKENIGDILRLGGASTIAFLLFLAVAVLFDFSGAFILMHRIMFTNTLWQIPLTEKLIQLFPEQFFRTTFLNILYASFTLGVIALSLGTYLKERRH